MIYKKLYTNVCEGIMDTFFSYLTKLGYIHKYVYVCIYIFKILCSIFYLNDFLSSFFWHYIIFFFCVDYFSFF